MIRYTHDEGWADLNRPAHKVFGSNYSWPMYNDNQYIVGSQYRLVVK